MKRWKLAYQTNMCADRAKTVFVKANTERKAKILAEQKLKNDGCFRARFISCAEADTP